MLIAFLFGVTVKKSPAPSSLFPQHYLYFYHMMQSAIYAILVPVWLAGSTLISVRKKLLYAGPGEYWDW